MNYIIFDLEWNQAPNEAAIIKEPLYLSGEIIEIGAVKLDDDFRLVDELKLYITPKYYTKLHKQVAALTHIREKDLAEQGLPFPEAFEKFSAWCGEEYTYMTWSMSDLPMLIDNMLLHGIDTTSLPDCCDIQRIFSREIMRNSTRYSLDTALNILKEKGDVAHDALHDARNTAKVCDHLDLEQYIGEYTSRVFAEMPDGKAYESHKQALADPNLLTIECPWCGEAITCESWVPNRFDTYMTCATCPEGDEFLVQLSLEKHSQTEYYAKRMFFDMSDDWWEIYMDRKEALGV